MYLSLYNSMKAYQRIGLWIAGVGLVITALAGGLRSCNNYDINNPNLTSTSRSTGFYRFTDKSEYTRLKDGSEEILIRDERRIYRFQNFDGDNTIDRIRIDEYKTRDVFSLENILVRMTDYSTNKKEFDKADNILLEERQREKE